MEAVESSANEFQAGYSVWNDNPKKIVHPFQPISRLDTFTPAYQQQRGMDAAAKTFDLISSSSETESSIDDTKVQSRPKLTTKSDKTIRKSIDEAPDSLDVTRPAKRRREASKPIQYFDDDDEEQDEPDQDGTEDYVDQEETMEEIGNDNATSRRRSGRKRKTVQSVIDVSDDEFIISSNEEEEKPKGKSKSKSKTAAKKKVNEKQKATKSILENVVDEESDESDDEVEDSNMTQQESDGFIIDKVLAREVHTLKEWKKMCWNKTTRFLTHCSIFLPDEEEENEEQSQKSELESTVNDDTPVPQKASNGENETEDAGEERFLIKWKTLSYLHTSWQTEEELLDTDKNAKGKIQRFREKEHRQLYTEDVQGDEYFNPEFRTVDRILEIRDRPQDDFYSDDAEIGENPLQYYLVKWKALPYDEITWEREDDVRDDAAVKLYNDRIVRATKRFKKIALAKQTPQSKRKTFRGYTAESPPPCKKEQFLQLRDYQLTGVNWMLFNWYQNRNSMLADEMGLGKTVQTVMFVNHLATVEHTPRPFIIVAPLSTLGHWQREFDNWTDLNAVVYHGSAAARQVLQKYEFFLSESELQRAEELVGKDINRKRPSLRAKRNCYRFDVLITTFEMATATDLYKLAQIDWQLMVVDEAHRLKNRNSKLSTILHSRFTYENMLLLTGTPLQNNVEELWVLLNFLDVKKFQSKETFLESFGALTDSAQVEHLHSELKPYLLRRMKEDVEKSLAPKEETIIEVELTVLQKQYYRAIYEKNTEFLSRGGKKGDTPSLMNVLMELRKCCNHPFLVKGVEEREVKRLTNQTAVSAEEIQRQISESLVNTSGKLVLLDKLLPRLKETGHRVLIFSQFKIMLDIIQDYLALRRYNCERIDGNITGNERQTAIDRFCRKDSSAFIMLLSTRAGGVGINLTAADTVIIYDSDWNPQNDLQAQARCHRIGQKKSVKIYRLLSSKTYELHMFHKASMKLGLDQAVLGGIKNHDPVAKLKGAVTMNKSSDRMSKEEIENLLKHGAYEMFKEQDSEAEAASKRFGEESIDQILSRSTTIVHDPTREAGAKNEQKNIMSSFSKATFVSSTNPDEEVDVDDPNFWTKVIGLKGVEEQKKQEPSPLLKRRCRRKVKSYLMEEDKAYMMEESGEDTPSARKKLVGEFKDEEFVISDDEDDEEDELSDVQEDPSVVSSNGKRKRSKLPVLPITTHIERIGDLLQTFGYGRWQDLKRHATVLQEYPDTELIQFVHLHICSLVRVATAMTAFPRIGISLEPGLVYIVNASLSASKPPGVASPLEKYARELSTTCRRYPFLSTMLKDMNAANLVSVAVPPRLWITDFNGRAARGSRTKLQQIDTMYKLSELVTRQFKPVAPLVALIKDLQRVGKEAEVQRLIETGTLPKTIDASPAVKTKEAPSDKKVDLHTEPTSKEDPSSKNENVHQNVEVAPTKTVQNEEKAPLDPTSVDPSSESAGSEKMETKASTSMSHDTNESNASESNAPKSPSTKEDATDENMKTDENHNVTTALDDTGSKETPKVTQNEAKVIAERRQAMNILQELGPVNASEPIAPWWISRVDDVLLLINIYRDGWLKGRTLPDRLVNGSSLFGDRAKPHPVTEWPSVSCLNRRVKMLLQVWTGVKKKNPLDLVPSLSSVAAAPGTKQSRIHSLEQLQLQWHHRQRQQQLDQIQRQGQPIPSASLPGRPYANSSFQSSRRNQFAKLVFSYGIPDVGTCRNERERTEKWRYFLQDRHLDVGHSSLEELLAEALDLERVCRQRLVKGTDALETCAMSEKDSILGGKRGLWLLSLTQCRRLLHRVDFFRLLRTQILVLPPGQLVEIVSRVVRVQAASTEYPAWWSCPRHDILLLQGVECYGLDDHLASVWKLPLFMTANTTSPFPSSSWVENYVTALALACRTVLVATQAYRAEAKRSDGTACPTSERVLDDVSRCRIRDIRGMREEDPYFIPAVRLRQVQDTTNAAAWKKDSRQGGDERSEEENVGRQDEKKTVLWTPAEETVRLQQEDPYESESVRKLWAVQTRQDEIQAAKERSGGKSGKEKEGKKATSDKKKKKEQLSTDSEVICLDEKAGDTKTARPQASRSPAATEGEKPNETKRKLRSMQEKKDAGKSVAARSWDVIVIDDSD